MTHWPVAMNTAISLIIGGALAMAGQALADRRARRREREARRETFRIQNFAVQQEALMKVQELVEEFSDKLYMEYAKRKIGVNGYRYSDDLVIRMTDGLEELEPILGRLGTLHESTIADPEREQEYRRIEDFIEQNTRELHLFGAAVKEHTEFTMQCVTLSQDLSIHVPRTGSQLVAAETRKYLQAVSEYRKGSIIIAKDLYHLVSEEQAAKGRLQAAIGRALREGPFAE